MTRSVTEKFDIAIVGAGMAGASLAAELAPHASVVILEAEHAPGYHATGRSAAFWVESYGGRDVQPLTAVSGPWLAAGGFLKPRGGLTIAQADQIAMLDCFERAFTEAGIAMERIDRAQMERLVPGITAAWVAGVLEPESMDIDVAALHAHYLAAMRKAGAQLWCRAALTGAKRARDGWHLVLANGASVSASILVNAAGAWADTVARDAGCAPLGIQPMRRTMLQLDVDPQPDPAMPVVLDVGGTFYFKPESGRLWLSPHDETPSAPCDAAPEELDVALAMDRLGQVTDWKVRRLERKWAGLRSFAPDRLPVYGFDPANPAFFWFVGQGGFGIQTAPAAARLAARQILGQGTDAMTCALDPALYSPMRFA
ncbi:MAG: NAD(P)/FAD-dependent oxidoreductase [Novosphingobium sp.]